MPLPAIRLTEELFAAYYKIKGEETPAGLNESITQLLESDDSFNKKVQLLDTLLEEFKIDDDVVELVFDLLLFNFFSEDSRRLNENFFESKEWEKIENTIIDRGTELLNILLYLQECRDSLIQFSLDDYLDEYLITDDDFDQEEREVYEAIVKNRDVIEDGNLQTMVEISNNNSESPLGDQLLPVLLFFESESGFEKKYDIIAKSGDNPTFQIAFLAVLSKF